MNSNSGKLVLWDTSPPSSWSAGFPNKVTILCPNSSSLDLLACHVASSMSLDSVKKKKTKVTFFFIFKSNNSEPYVTYSENVFLPPSESSYSDPMHSQSQYVYNKIQVIRVTTKGLDVERGWRKDLVFDFLHFYIMWIFSTCMHPNPASDDI